MRLDDYVRLDRGLMTEDAWHARLPSEKNTRCSLTLVERDRAAVRALLKSELMGWGVGFAYQHKMNSPRVRLRKESFVALAFGGRCFAWSLLLPKREYHDGRFLRRCGAGESRNHTRAKDATLRPWLEAWRDGVKALAERSKISYASSLRPLPPELVGLCVEQGAPIRDWLLDEGVACDNTNTPGRAARFLAEHLIK